MSWVFSYEGRWNPISFFCFFTAKGYTSAEKTELLDLLSKALKTLSRDTFNQTSEKIISHPKFGNYYLKNWMPIRKLWAEHELKDVYNFGYITNNFLESSHQKIKLTLSSSSTIIDLIKSLLNVAAEKKEKANHYASKLKFKAFSAQVSNVSYRTNKTSCCLLSLLPYWEEN